MNKGAAIYAKLALNENAYKDVVYESRLGAISKLKKNMLIIVTQTICLYLNRIV